METKLEYLKSKNDDSHMNDIITLEQNIKDVYEKKTDSSVLMRFLCKTSHKDSYA